MDPINMNSINMANSLNRFINFPMILTRKITKESLFAAILNEAVALTNCDGATLYTPGPDGLDFQHMITRSKNWEWTSQNKAIVMKPVPMEKRFVCSYVAMSAQPTNIMDVYEAREYDFEGTYQYDQQNHYRTKTMLVVPMKTEPNGLVGVIQLINAMDEDGNIVPFVMKHVQIVMSLGALAALKLDNMKLHGEI